MVDVLGICFQLLFFLKSVLRWRLLFSVRIPSLNTNSSQCPADETTSETLLLCPFLCLNQAASHKRTLTHGPSEVIASVFLDETKGRRRLCNHLDPYQRRDAYSICCLNPPPITCPPTPTAPLVSLPPSPLFSEPPLMCWVQC